MKGFCRYAPIFGAFPQTAVFMCCAVKMEKPGCLCSMLFASGLAVLCCCVGCLKMWGWVKLFASKSWWLFYCEPELATPRIFFGSFGFIQDLLPANPPIIASHLQPSHWLHGFPLQSRVWGRGLFLSSGLARDLLKPPSWCRTFRHVSSRKLSEDQRRAAVNSQRDVLAVLLQPSPKHAMNLGCLPFFASVILHISLYRHRNLDIHCFIWQVLHFMICEMNNDPSRGQTCK